MEWGAAGGRGEIGIGGVAERKVRISRACCWAAGPQEQKESPEAEVLHYREANDPRGRSEKGKATVGNTLIGSEKRGLAETRSFFEKTPLR